ncbi:major tail protein [Miniphocaeibacter massiliensis]|uniref:major tail protein n=1 Tax=Miniphocaeibacter massiliensis TaxID=2041841 RepID=UPI000C1BAFFC|nr:major tail protein [Miniphocaeibacter massiliensis]
MEGKNNKYEYGIENVHIWPIENENGQDIEYAKTPIRVLGAVTMKLSPIGDSSTIYADNSAYVTISANGGYEGEWESYQLPEEMETKILGIIKDNNGALIESSEAKQKNFGISFQFIGDQNNARVFGFYCSMSQRPSDEKTTKGESVEPTANVFTFKMMPRLKDKLVKAKLYEDRNPEAYAKFFDAPYEPVFTTPEA